MLPGPLLFLKRRLALLGCLLCLACGTTSPNTYQINLTNPFGTPFQSKQEVLEKIPLGTAVDDAKAKMHLRGFEMWSSQRQHEQLLVVYHVPDLAGLRDPNRDIWVTLHFKEGSLVDVDYRSGTDGPAPPTGNR